jgi:hypothetical protein
VPAARVDNHPSLWWFFNKVKRLWLALLKRRSQTARLNWGEVSSSSLTASFRQERYTRYPVTASTPKPEGGARCVSSARRDLSGLRLASALKSAVCDDGRGKA